MSGYYIHAPSGFVHRDTACCDRDITCSPVVVLDLDGRFAHFPESLRFLADNSDHFNGTLLREVADQIEDQTRPPKPDEPLGLGAVVEDDDGLIWVRYLRSPDRAWESADGLSSTKRYGQIRAVKVHSHGWSE